MKSEISLIVPANKNKVRDKVEVEREVEFLLQLELKKIRKLKKNEVRIGQRN